MSKKTKTATCIITFLIMAFIAMAGLFICNKNREYHAFMKDGVFADKVSMYINDMEMDVSGMKPEDVYKQYKEESDKDFVMMVTLNNNITEIDLSECYSRTLKEEDLKKYAKEVSFMDYLFPRGKNIRINDDIKYLGGAGDKVRELVESGEYDYTESKDAYFDKEKFETVPEVYGTQIDADIAAELAEEAAASNADGIVIDDSPAYIEPQVKKEEIEERFAGVKKILEWSAQYSVSEHIIRMSDYKDRIQVNDDGTYQIEDSFLRDAVLALSKTIDKTYESIKFKSSKDGMLTVKGGTYGKIMDNAEEIKFLSEKLKNAESVKDRQPVWKCAPLKEGENPSEYVEVDISAQHVWHYKDGKKHCESDCVTGTYGRHDTPEGAYYISEMINGKYLTGEDYRTWVNKWMRLTNRGIGLHDAGWRGRFGGSIYKSSGSHGCINLPPAYAAKLYSELRTNMLVVVHQ